MLEHVAFILKVSIPQSQSVFYKDTIQAVIIFASMKKLRLFISTLNMGR